jgi:hypothetical protein
MLALHSLIRFMTSRGPKAQRAVIFDPLSRAWQRILEGQKKRHTTGADWRRF